MEKSNEQRRESPERPEAKETREPARPFAMPRGLRQFYGLGSGPAGATPPAPATGGGGALPPAARKKMESAFGADFGSVRVHEGPDAAAHGAIAFAHGEQLHFRPGAYQPDSESGQRLLGHELAHVLQQRAGRVSGGAAINTDASLEAEAETAGAAAARGERAVVAGAGNGAAPATVMQRAVGFEFEVSNWHTARLLDPGATKYDDGLLLTREHSTGGKLSARTPLENWARERGWTGLKMLFRMRSELVQKKVAKPLIQSEQYSLARQIKERALKAPPKVELEGFDALLFKAILDDKSLWTNEKELEITLTEHTENALAAMIKEVSTSPEIDEELQAELDQLDQSSRVKGDHDDYRRIAEKKEKRRSPVEKRLFAELGEKGAAEPPKPGKKKFEHQFAGLKKKDHVLTGDGFSLQADEVNNGTTDLEVVTDPFEENADGLGRLIQVMGAVDRVAKFLRADKKEFFLSSELADFGVPRAGTIIIPGATMTANMQMSAAIWPRMIGTLMEQIGKPASETVTQKQDRQAGRAAMGGGPEGNPTVGEAPGWARAALADWKKKYTAPDKLKEKQLEGLVALLVEYLVVAVAMPSTIGYPKTISPLMLRTDFAKFFEVAIGSQSRDAFTAKDGLPFIELVLDAARRSGKGAFDADVDLFEFGVYRNSPDPRLPGELLSGLTRGAWLRGITEGVDLLTAKNFPSKMGGAHLESMGEMGGDVGQVGKKQGHRAPIMEFRLMSGPGVDSAIWFSRTLNLFEYVVNLNRGDKKTKFTPEGERDLDQSGAQSAIAERLKKLLGGGSVDK